MGTVQALNPKQVLDTTMELSSPDFVRKSMPGDGSCLFHAVSTAADGEADAASLRALAASEVGRRQSEELNGASVAQWIEWETGLSPEEYARSMMGGKSWGGQVELALLSHALERPIHVYRQERPGLFTLDHSFDPPSSSPSAEALRVIFDGSHYDALVRASASASSGGGGGKGMNGMELANSILEKGPDRKYGQLVEGYPKPKAGEHTATVIWLHGLGDSGFGWAPVAESFGMPHCKFIFPTAPTEAVTLNNGMEMPSWFDLAGLDETSPEDSDRVLSSAAYLASLVQREVDGGIAHDRIVVAGFSQGGAVALTCGLMMTDSPVAGIVAASTWLPHAVRPTDVGIKSPLLMCHGTADPVVMFDWGKMSHEKLVKMGIKSEFKSYKGMDHGFCPEELSDVAKFLQKALPKA